MMTPEDVKTIYELLANRVTPVSAREGEQIMMLGRRLVAHFANAAAPAPAPPDPAK